MSEDQKLLPCPFCGGLDVRIETHEFSRDWETNYVACDCGAEGPAKGNRDWAIATWNRRAAASLADRSAGDNTKELG